MDEHPMYQYQGFISPTEYQHLKLESPWVFATKKSFNWAVVPPLYNSQHAGGYTALPGVVDLRYVRATNVQLILPRDPAVPKKVALNLNDPLLMYLPMTENGVEYRHHLVSQAEFAAMHPPALKFNGSGMALRRLRKAADAAQHCPFHNE
jgi:hypothetical protein